jgi:hypothetical protein
MRRTLRPPSPVLWTGILAGLSVLYMALVLPLGRGTDEAQHAFRAYQLSLGHLFPQLVSCSRRPIVLPCKIHYPGRLVPHKRTGGVISASLYDVYTRLQNLAQRRGEGSHFNPHVYLSGLSKTLGGPTIFAHFENTAIYSPVNYLPQTLMMFIGRETSASVVATLFSARLLTGFVWAALVTAAVAIAPRHKWLFVLVGLVPTAIAQGSMLATDSISLGLAPFTVAIALRLADRGTPLRGRELAPLSGLCVALALLKVPMPVLVLGIAAVAWPALGAGAARARRLAVLIVPALAAALWWTVASSRYYVPYRNTIFQAAEQVNVNPAHQETYLLAHLYDVPALLWQTLTHEGLFRLDGLVGTIGQDGGAGPLPEWFAIVWLVVLIGLAAISGEGKATGRGRRLSMVGTVLLFGLAGALGTYVTWNAVGASTINGIHGRYYTPALILLVPIFAGLAAGPAHWRHRGAIVAPVVMALTLAGVLTVFARTSAFYYHQAPWEALSRVVSVVL